MTQCFNLLRATRSLLTQFVEQHMIDVASSIEQLDSGVAQLMKRGSGARQFREQAPRTTPAQPVQKLVSIERTLKQLDELAQIDRELA